MLRNVILLVDKRDVLSVKYKKILMKNNFCVFNINNLQDALNMAMAYEPEIVIISDSINEKLPFAIKKTKDFCLKFHPNIIALSKSNHLQDKLDALNSGADDYFSEPIEPIEFATRINAHIRRICENSLCDRTRIFNEKTTLKILKRSLMDTQNYAYLYICINNFRFYNEIYGKFASEKMLETYFAIITSTIDEKDYVGEIFENDFLLITNFLKAEKIAKYLVYTFETVVKNFYSQTDLNRGFFLLNNDVVEEAKTDFTSTQIGVILNENKKYKTVKSLLNALFSLNKLAKIKNRSNYIMEHPKLETKICEDKKPTQKVTIIEEDESLGILLQTHFELQGFEVCLIKNFEDVFKIENFSNTVFILDAGEPETMKGIEVCKKIKNEKSFSNSRIILTTVFHNKEKILLSGADLYLPKPYELDILFHWVKQFFNEILY